MIWTEGGLEKVVEIVKTDRIENMYDVELPESTNHRYYTNGILSHNTTIYTVYLLWYAMYHPDKRVMVCGNKLDIAIEIMDRIRLGYEYCPKEIKIGVTTYNKKCIEFENNSIIRCFATGSSGCRGFSANCVSGDTMVTIVDDYDNVYYVPIEQLASIEASKVLTEHGFKDFLGVRKVKAHLIYRVGLDDGTHLDATSEHRIKKDDGKFVTIKECKIGQRLSTGQVVKTIVKRVFDDFVYDLLDVDGGSEYLTNGVTSHNCLVMDEAAFLPKGIADEFMASVFPVLSSSKDSKAIMVSTPNGTSNNLFYDTWQQATDPNIVQDENWKAFRFLWYDVPGRDEEWKRQQIATIGINRWMQEFECEFKSSGDASLVPSDSIEHFRMNLKNYPKPAQLNLSKNQDKEITANFWKPFDPTRTYAASGDISEGTGNDSSVANVWDVTDVKHIQLVARMSCSKATLVDFGYATYEFLKLYAFPPFIVENNGVGSGFVDIMLDTYNYPQERMFYEQAISPTGKYGEITYGVKSKNKTKLEACMFLNELITTDEVEIAIPDELLVNEMGTFVRKSTSNSITFAAKDKCHDDYMLSWIWGMYLLFADVIKQHYSVVKAFKTKMDRVLPEKVIYTSPFDQSLLDETANLEANKGIISQLGNLEEHKLVKLNATERSIPDDELFYGNRKWGHGRNRDFFTINETFDFGNGQELDDGEEAYNVLTEF